MSDAKRDGDDEVIEAEATVVATDEHQDDANTSQITHDYDKLAKAGISPYIMMILYSLLCGLMLIIFSVIQDFSKYIFSLIALYAGFKFFQKYDSVKVRVFFVILSIVFFFVGFIIFVVFALIYEWNIPGFTDVILDVD